MVGAWTTAAERWGAANAQARRRNRPRRRARPRAPVVVASVPEDDRPLGHVDAVDRVEVDRDVIAADLGQMAARAARDAALLAEANQTSRCHGASQRRYRPPSISTPWSSPVSGGSVGRRPASCAPASAAASCLSAADSPSQPKAPATAASTIQALKDRKPLCCKNCTTTTATGAMHHEAMFKTIALDITRGRARDIALRSNDAAGRHGNHRVVVG